MHLMDGYQTLISFASAPLLELWEKRVKPPGLDAGGAIDETTMRNQNWRTKHPKALVTMTDCTVVGAWEPAEAYLELLPAMAVVDVITITFPDGTDLLWYGWIDKWDPGELVEGEQPTATVTVIASSMEVVTYTEQTITIIPGA
jgi:hypothetical protein